MAEAVAAAPQAAKRAAEEGVVVVEAQVQVQALVQDRQQVLIQE